MNGLLGTAAVGLVLLAIPAGSLMERAITQFVAAHMENKVGATEDISDRGDVCMVKRTVFQGLASPNVQESSDKLFVRTNVSKGAIEQKQPEKAALR